MSTATGVQWSPAGEWLDGLLDYHADAVDAATAAHWFQVLRDSLDWQQPKVTLFGRTHASPRLAAWHGDAGAVYTYSGLRNEPAPWTDCLAQIRQRVESLSGASFNSVLVNRYRDGNDAMGWHSDDESSLDPDAPIASLSLGAARRFRLKHRRLGQWRGELRLEGGSLLVMHPPMQSQWRHAVPREAGAGERINLTFRRVR